MSFPLQFLIDQAKEQVEAAAKQLGLFNKEVGEMEQKLALLNNYRQEYQQRLQDSAMAGITPEAMRNFREFTRKLDLAIEEQQKIVALSIQKRAAGQIDWQEKQKKLKSFETLAERQRLHQAKKEAKREQKEMDEFAAKSHRLKE